MANLEEDAMFVPTFTEQGYEVRLATLFQTIRSECALLIQQPYNDERVIELLLCVARLSRDGQPPKLEPVSYRDNEQLFAMLKGILQTVKSLSAASEYDNTLAGVAEYIRGQGFKASPDNVEKLYQELVRYQFDPTIKVGTISQWQYERGQLHEAWSTAEVG